LDFATARPVAFSRLYRQVVYSTTLPVSYYSIISGYHTFWSVCR